MQRDQRNVLQRPAHPRRGETESRRLRQADKFLRRHECRNLLADAEMKGIAARQHHDGTPAMPLDLGERIGHRARPRQTPAFDQFTSQFQMARAADHQFRRTDQPARDGRKSFHAVFADADNGQPALPRANCGLSHHGTGLDARSHSRRFDGSFGTGAAAGRTTAASRRRCRWPGARLNPREQPVRTRQRRLRRHRRAGRMAAAGSHSRR